MPAARHSRLQNLLRRRVLRRWRSRRRSGELFRLLVLSLLGILLLPIMAAPALAASEISSLPHVGGLSAQTLNQDTLIYDRTGNLLADIGAAGDHRIVVPLRYISPLVKQATIATEDRTFYHNDGVDLGSIGRAAWANLTHHRISQGGSTISQQLVKQVFIPNASATIDRKVREAMLALEMNRQYSKDQILEMYLNTIYYGSQSYGIEAAARDYFQISAHDLTLAQAAMLAGLPQAPTRYNPILHPQLAKARQAEVLRAMVAQRDITQEQADKALAESLTFYPPINKLNAPHFVDYVLGVLAKNFHIKPSDRKGYRITTSLDLGLQHQAEAIIRDQVAAVGDYYNFHDGALVSLDPRTGEVLAMVGGNDYNRPGGQINMAVTARQPGSSFKIFTYTAAIESRQVNMLTPILDEPLVFPLGSGKDGLLPYQPQNYDRRYHGVMPLKMAMGNSLNIPALKTELMIGIPTVLSAARRMGVTSLTQPDDSYRMSLTLGGYEVPLLDMATGASTLATLGVRRDPSPILKIEDGLGHLKYRYDPKKNEKRAVDPQVAFIIASIMGDDRNRCMAFGCFGDLTLPGRHVAAKTGTTQDFRDNWTVGFTPSLTTAVWVGNPDYVPLSHNSTGIVGAAPIWHRFMQTALASTPDEWYDMPAGVTQAYGNFFLAGTERVSSTLAYSWPRCRFWRYDPRSLTDAEQLVNGLPCVLGAPPTLPQQAED
jgi:membrane peptidoglycan carboxypeptidase